jgi:hypothetical protein
MEIAINNQKSTRLDDSLFSKDLAPHYMQLAGKLSSSELVPKSFRGKPQDLFLCWAMGYQVGLSPEQSMQCIAVINGKPAMWGDDMLALCMTHKDFEDIIEEPLVNSEGTIIGYSCTVKRKGRADKINIFTLEMAKKAGLLSKGGVWIQYTERMLKLRARGFSLRDAFPDALKGIKPREEAEDYIDGEYTVSVGDKTSRTELLKKDFLTKTGKLNERDSDGQIKAHAHQLTGEKTIENETANNLDSPGAEKIEMHSEIKRLMLETGFSDERMTKALEYYEVDKIDALTEEQQIHFISQLEK